MSLTAQLDADMKAAMKAKEADKLSTLRMVKSAIQLQEVENRGPLSDEAAIKVLQKLCKQRKEAMEQFEAGGRPELATKERQELAIIEAYLPAAVDEAAIRAAVQDVVAHLGVATPKQMGLVMKEVMARFKGQTVDGKVVQSIVKETLESAGG